MASFEEEFYLENPSRMQTFIRDVRLLTRLARLALLWLTTGFRVRRQLRRSQLENNVLILEDVLPRTESELAE